MSFTFLALCEENANLHPELVIRGEGMDTRIGLILIDSGMNVVYLCNTAAEILRTAATTRSTATSDPSGLQADAVLGRLDAVPCGTSVDVDIGGCTYRLSQTAMRGVSTNQEQLTAIILERISERTANLTVIAKLYRLTRREQEVLALVLKGKSPKDIAGRLSISSNTAKAFVRALIAKTGASGRAELIAKLLDIN